MIRHQLFGGDAAQFTGCVAWRGLIPVGEAAAALLAQRRRQLGRAGGHVINYLLRRGELFNFVGIVERGDWRVESWTEKGTRDGMRGGLFSLAR